MPDYSDTVKRHFNEPRNVGRLEDPDGEGRSGGARAGPFMVFSARLEGSRIGAIRFQTYGCPAAIAAGSFLASELDGKELAAIHNVTERSLLEGLGGLPPEKHHCVTLAVEAVRRLGATLEKKLESP